MSKVFVDLSENHPQRIEVKFKYEPTRVQMIKTISGAKFVNQANGGPYWHVPLEVGVCFELRRLFGQTLGVSQRLSDWAREAIQTQKEMEALGSSEDAHLVTSPQVIPELSETLHPYQRVATLFAAKARVSLIADQPGLGKTLEAIAAVYESENYIGPQLVIAPKVSLHTVWEKELSLWATGPVYVLHERGKRTTPLKKKKEIIRAFRDDPAETKWLVVNPESVRYDKEGRARLDARTMKEAYALRPKFRVFYETEWASIIIDECHKGAVRNPGTLTAKSLYDLPLRKGGLKIALSGTPMKNKAMDLWGVLHWLDKDRWSSKWEFANRYCVIKDNGFGKKIEGVRPEMEEELWKVLSGIMIRRKKEEVHEELPPKQYVPVWCDLTPAQKKQYNAMKKNAMVRLGEENVSATNVLTEFLRLKQFAICKYDETGDNDQPIGPSWDGGKLDQLVEILEERDIFDGWEPAGEKVVVFSQFRQVVDMIVDYLREKGVAVAKITGQESGYVTPRGWEKVGREEVQEAFQRDGGPSVIVMTTTAAGVAITLDRADSLVFMDEMWSPADMEQAEDRIHRVSRIHNVTIYTLRTRGTIDEYIYRTVREKQDAARILLDDYRSGGWAN